MARNIKDEKAEKATPRQESEMNYDIALALAASKSLMHPETIRTPLAGIGPNSYERVLKAAGKAYQGISDPTKEVASDSVKKNA